MEKTSTLADTYPPRVGERGRIVVVFIRAMNIAHTRTQSTQRTFSRNH